MAACTDESDLAAFNVFGFMLRLTGQVREVLGESEHQTPDQAGSVLNMQERASAYPPLLILRFGCLGKHCTCWQGMLQC